MRPAIGGVTLLVYRECVCGEWCATGEGARAPICPYCGGLMVPGGGAKREVPMYGTSHGEARRMRALAFVGFLTSETGAVGLVSRVRRFLGLVTDDAGIVAEAGTRSLVDDRHFTPAECEWSERDA